MNDNQLTDLEELGWDSFFQENFRLLQIPDCIPARVVSEQRHSYRMHSQYGELTAKISGKLRYQASTSDQYPAVGDWVAVKQNTDESRGIIHAILPRKSKFSRQAAGSKTEEQVVAANVDTVFIVSGLDGGRNLNLRRIERYLTLAWESGATPVIILNKVDLCNNVEERIHDTESVALGVPVHAISATRHLGLEALLTYMGRGITAALLGPSGVGKSAIINALYGSERQQVGEVRESDKRGRHTTTSRELIILPGGGLIIDTPGMREIQVWGNEGNLNDTFGDIEQIAEKCRFKNCTHLTEPGCAVQAAIQRGELDDARFQNYQKLQREMEYQVARQEDRVRLEEKTKWKKIAQWSKQIKQTRDRYQ
jgi:ribosome biogenesis GTPase